MSCYEWEQGSIKIPARQWVKVENAILAAAKRLGNPTLSDDDRVSFRQVNPYEFVVGFGSGDTSITVSRADRTVFWQVSENNRAVECAHEHPMGVAFFDILGSVRYTRGSGGVIVGNDEYNRDSVEVDGGGNYETCRFGPERKRKKIKELRA